MLSAAQDAPGVGLRVVASLVAGARADESELAVRTERLGAHAPRELLALADRLEGFLASTRPFELEPARLSQSLYQNLTC